MSVGAAVVEGRICNFPAKHCRSVVVGCVCVAIGLAIPKNAEAQHVDVLQTWDGQKFEAEWHGFDRESKPVFLRSGAEFSLEDTRFWRWGRWTRNPREPLMVFADGSLLAAVPTRYESDALVARSRLWDEQRIGADQLRGLLLAPDASVSRRSTQLKTLREPRDVDRVWLVGGDWIDGQVLRMTAAENGGWSFRLKPKGSDASVELEGRQVWAVSFTTKPAASGLSETADPQDVGSDASRIAPKLRLGFRDGSLLNVRQCELVDGLIRLELASSFVLAEAGLSVERFKREIRLWENLDIFGPNMLGQTPVQEGQVSWLGPAKDSRWGTIPGGGPIQIDSEWFPEGRMALGSSTMVYRLSETQGTAHWLVGVCDSSPVDQVVVQVFVQDVERGWSAEPAWSASLSRGELPVAHTFSLERAKSIALNVQGTEAIGPSPQVAWLRLHFAPSPGTEGRRSTGDGPRPERP